VAREVLFALHKHRASASYWEQFDHYLSMLRKHLDIKATVVHNGNLCSKMGSEYWPLYSADVPP